MDAQKTVNKRFAMIHKDVAKALLFSLGVDINLSANSLS